MASFHHRHAETVAFVTACGASAHAPTLAAGALGRQDPAPPRFRVVDPVLAFRTDPRAVIAGVLIPGVGAARTLLANTPGRPTPIGIGAPLRGGAPPALAPAPKSRRGAILSPLHEPRLHRRAPATTPAGAATGKARRAPDPRGSGALRLREVEMGGIEPPSDVVLPGLLRAQSKRKFLSPKSHHLDKWLVLPGSVAEKVPSTPATQVLSSGYLADASIPRDSSGGLTDRLAAIRQRERSQCAWIRHLLVCRERSQDDSASLARFSCRDSHRRNRSSPY